MTLKKQSIRATQNLFSNGKMNSTKEEIIQIK